MSKSAFEKAIRITRHIKRETKSPSSPEMMHNVTRDSGVRNIPAIENLHKPTVLFGDEKKATPPSVAESPTKINFSSISKSEESFFRGTEPKKDIYKDGRNSISPLRLCEDFLPIEHVSRHGIEYTQDMPVMPSLDTAIIVSGANGIIAKEIIMEFGKDLASSSAIIGLTRKKLTEEQCLQQERENKRTGKTYQQVSCDYTDEGFREVLEEVANAGYKKVVLVNTVGGANLEPGSSYKALNVDPVVTMCRGLAHFQISTGIDVSIVHLSSHTTAVLPDGLDPYINSRYEAERIIKDSGLPFTTIRLGIITNNPVKRKEDGKIVAYWDTGYEYSPERNATLPISVSLGDPDLPLQWCDVKDVAGAVRRLAYGGQICGSVNAVSSDMATQEDVNATLRMMQGKPYRHSHFPLHLAAAIVNCDGGRGRFTPYAINWAAGQLAHKTLGAGLFMDPEKFKCVLGRKTAEYSGIFDGIDLVKFPETRIVRHGLELLEGSINDRVRREQIIKSIDTFGGLSALTRGAVIAVMGAGNALAEPALSTTGLDLRYREQREDIIAERRKDAFSDRIDTINDPRIRGLIKHMKGERTNTQTPNVSRILRERSNSLGM